MNFFKEFPDEITAEQWFIENRWDDSPYCPQCRTENVQFGTKHKTMTHRSRNRDCRKRLSVRTGTVMESSSLGFQNWLLAIYNLTTSLKSVSSMKLDGGCGAVDKAVVVGIMDRDSNKVKAQVFENYKRRPLHGFINSM